MSSPTSGCGTRKGSSRTASHLVAMSSTRTPTRTPQNRLAFRLLLLVIFLALFAVDAVTCVRQGIQALEGNVLSAGMTLSERLRALVQPAKCLVYVPEKATFLAGKEESLFAFHGIRTLVRHVERVRAQITIRRLRCVGESLLVIIQFLEHTIPLFHESLLEVRNQLLGHAPWLAGSTAGGHADYSLVRASRAVIPSRSTSARA